MEFANNKEVITIFDKRGKVLTLATKLAALSGNQVKEFFDVRLNKLPRQLNRLAIMKVLNDKIPTLNSLSLTKDMFAKLQFYKDLTEFQLQTLFEKIGDDADFLQYRINLWTLIIRNHEILNLLDGEVQHLSRIKKQPVEDFVTYSKAINEVSVDVNRYFDGIPSKQIEEIFNNTFSLDELRRLAGKYGFEIPARLKKTEFSEFLKQILKSKKKLTVALSKEIDEMTVVQLNSLCQVHEVMLSSNLKKNEIVFLMLFLIKKNKLTTSEIKGVSDTWGITPLEFTVDLDKIDNFGRGEAKNVIILPTDEVEEEPQEEETASAPKDITNDELFKEIARKLGLIQAGNDEEVQEEKYLAPKQKVAKAKTSSETSPADRLALARQRKQELALERKLEEERKALEEEKRLFEEQKRIFEEQQALEEERRLLEEQQALEEERRNFEEEKRAFEEQQAIEKEKKEKDRLQEILNKLLNKPTQEISKEDENQEVYESENHEEFSSDEFDDTNDIEESSDEFDDTNDIEESLDELNTVENDDFEDEADFAESNESLETQEEVIDNVGNDDEAISADSENNEEEKETESSEVAQSTESTEAQEVLSDESYDESFNPLEGVNVSEVIENPYYNNRKFAIKNRTGLKVFFIILGAILFFGAGLVASKFLM